MAKFNVPLEDCNRLNLWAVIIACILLLKLYLFITTFQKKIKVQPEAFSEYKVSPGNCLASVHPLPGTAWRAGRRWLIRNWKQLSQFLPVVTELC